MNISEKEYRQMSKQASPGSPVGKDCTKAFLVGGLLCGVGEVLFQLLRQAELAEKDARMLVSSTLILLAVILTGFKVFDNIAKHAGAGTLVPITGFANSVVAPAIEFKTDERDIIGLSRKAP
ncbi:MAG: SpoVA/SpoVAEb family sporulation membrane protein [Clostridia bacterium]|nr:SpoVA/SpoVAEb family sporulation membrane protein [Clostridia bacterium]